MAKQVDFGQVAKECGIVTKGAAAKRYERMMRAHGIASNATTIKPAPASRTTKNEHRPSMVTPAVSPKSKPSSSPSSSAAALAAAKKRKIDEFDKANFPCDDDESVPYTLPSNQILDHNTIVKAEGGNNVLKEVKTEGHNYGVERTLAQPQAMSISAAENLLRYYDSPSSSPPLEHSSGSTDVYTNVNRNNYKLSSINDTSGSSYDFGGQFGSSTDVYNTLSLMQPQDSVFGFDLGPEYSFPSAFGNGFSNGTGSSSNSTSSSGLGQTKVGGGTPKWNGNLGADYETHYQSYARYEGESSGSGLPDSPVIIE
ncbi:hypothetical protein B0J14DRAFT_702928 [Halenospora varia]|nr:hypothetical protein B0J14DRAFT_702928 [Halenospora varia]